MYYMYVGYTPTHVHAAVISESGSVAGDHVGTGRESPAGNAVLNYHRIALDIGIVKMCKLTEKLNYGVTCAL